jgi:hypothetical protein
MVRGIEAVGTVRVYLHALTPVSHKSPLWNGILPFRHGGWAWRHDGSSLRVALSDTGEDAAPDHTPRCP